MENKTNDKNNIEDFLGVSFLKMIRMMCLKKAEDD